MLRPRAVHHADHSAQGATGGPRPPMHAAHVEAQREVVALGAAALPSARAADEEMMQFSADGSTAANDVSGRPWR